LWQQGQLQYSSKNPWQHESWGLVSCIHHITLILHFFFFKKNETG
jgi:hypothetical protein